MWLLDWINRLCGKQVLVLPPASILVSDETLESGDYLTSPKFILNSPVGDIFQKIAREAAETRTQKEAATFTNDKLLRYFKNTIEYCANDSFTKQGDINCLINAGNVGVPDEMFMIFYHIFSGVCKEIDIKIDWSEGNNLIRVNKASFRKAIENLQPKRIDIDEKIRAMLHTGVYR